jgi:hypothetical protein
MATDLERLIVTIEANTKQFERAMRSLEKTTDQAMAGVERSVRASQARQESIFGSFGSSIGNKFTASFRKAFLAYFGVQFIEESVKAAALAGDPSAKRFQEAWDTAFNTIEVHAGITFSRLGNALIGYWDAYMRTVREGMATLQQVAPEAAKELFPYGTKGLELTVYPKPQPAAKAPAAPKLGALQAPGAEELAAFDKVMKDLIFEERQLGRTAEKQRVYNELKKAGVNKESEYGQAIALTTRQLYQEEQALRTVKELNDGLEESTKTFVQGLIDGQSAAESFSAALRKMADVLLDIALHNLFNPGGTPLLQGLFGKALGLGQWSGGILGGGGAGAGAGAGGSLASVSQAPLGGSSRMGGGAAQFHTAINVQGSVDQRTLSAMNGMIQRNNQRQNQELQRNWGNMQSRYASLRGP